MLGSCFSLLINVVSQSERIIDVPFNVDVYSGMVYVRVLMLSISCDCRLKVVKKIEIGCWKVDWKKFILRKRKIPFIEVSLSKKKIWIWTWKSFRISAKPILNVKILWTIFRSFSSNDKKRNQYFHPSSTAQGRSFILNYWYLIKSFTSTQLISIHLFMCSFFLVMKNFN